MVFPFFFTSHTPPIHTQHTSPRPLVLLDPSSRLLPPALLGRLPISRGPLLEVEHEAPYHDVGRQDGLRRVNLEVGAGRGQRLALCVFGW